MTPPSLGRAGGRRGVVVLVLTFLAVAAAPHRAVAAAAAGTGAEEAAEARRRFKHGTKLFDEAKFLEAAHEFEEGYAIDPRPGFLANIGHSYRRAGDLKNAKRYYQMFLQQEDKDAPNRAEVSGYLKTIDDTLAEQAASEVPKDAQSIHEAPAPAPAPAPLVRAPVGRADGAGVWSRRLPWLVAGAAVVLAGTLGLLLAFDHPESRSDCGTLGCFNER